MMRRLYVNAATSASAALLLLVGCTIPAAASSSPTGNGGGGGVSDKLSQLLAKMASDLKRRSTFAGNTSPLLQYILVSQQEFYLIVNLLKTLHWQDFALLAGVAWLTVPLVQVVYFLSLSDRSDLKLPYRQSVVFQIADHLQQVTRIALAVYVVDIVKILSVGLGLPFTYDKFPNAFMQIAYTVWLANRGTVVVRLLLRKVVNRQPDLFGRMKIVQRLTDAVIYGVSVFCVLNILQVQMGVAMQSILAFGSVGTLAMGLASKGIATEVLNGLMLASSDRIYEGDSVRFGNGLSGTIVQLGWMETVMRGSDEILVSVPNTDLVRQRVANLSRVRLCQVKQVLRVKHDDAEKIPELMDRIKHEIKMACPHLITDGSRPFRVYWTAINSDHCEVTVDTRHRIKPTGDQFLQNQQNVLTAILRALKRHNCKLAEASP